MSAQRKPSLALGCQLDLIVDICQVNFCKAVTTFQFPHQVFWAYNWGPMHFELWINGDSIVPTNL